MASGWCAHHANLDGLDGFGGDIELHRVVGADAFLDETVGEHVIGRGEASAVVEGPLVLEDLPAVVGDVISGDFGADHVTKGGADVVQVRAEELAEAGGIHDGVHDLEFLGDLGVVLRFDAGVRAHARRVVRTHGAAAVGDTDDLERARVPGGE